MKFGIRLPKGIPYGGLFEIFKNSIFFPKIAYFVNWDLEKIRLPDETLWYNT